MGPIWDRQDPGGPHELCYLVYLAKEATGHNVVLASVHLSSGIRARGKLAPAAISTRITSGGGESCRLADGDPK